MRAPLIVLALAAWPATAHAQIDQKAADLAFDTGLQQMDARQFAAACQSFAASDAIDSTMSTRFQLGRCHEEQQHYVEARRHYSEAAKRADAAKDSEAAALARKRHAGLDAKIGRVSLTVPPPQRVAGLTVTRNGQPYPESDWAQPLEIDPGPIELHATAPGHKPADLRETVAPGAVAQLTLPPLVPEGSAPVPSPAGDPGERRNPALFYTGIGLTAAGGAALVTAVIVTAVEPCSSCDVQPGTIGFAIPGLLCAGAGIPLIIVFGKKNQPDSALEPVLVPGGAGVRGRF